MPLPCSFRPGLFTIALLPLLSAACSDADPEPQPLTYYSDTKAIIDRNCVRCHQAGGGAPFALDTYEAVSSMQAAVVDAVSSGRMPPWLPDPSCNRYVGERIMSDDDKATLLAWVDAGAAEGDSADAPAEQPPAPDLEGVTLSLVSPTPYTPDPTLPDDYRCIKVGERFSSDQWITGYQVVPDRKDLVHHVLLFVVPNASMEALDAADAADDGVGFTCFSDPGVDAALIGTWVPGAPPTTLPNRIGFEAPAGAQLVMQVHYNTAGGDVEPDLTEVRLATTDTAPDYIAQNLILVEDDFMIPAGEASYSITSDFENPTPLPITVLSALPHQHLLGKHIRAEHYTADGDSTCLVDIPQWDFNWQQTYDLNPSDFIVVEPGDGLRMTCEWDNSPANQPFINGERAEPVDVGWGEGTRDEMCVMIITVVLDRL